ncbi:MFS transporter [Leifsonia aquatica]|nr:MFS transporter [Leifsonia aquatica]
MLIGPKASTVILLFLNAVFSGSLGVSLVLTLNHAGVSKWGIAAFFVVWNVSGAAINLMPHQWLKGMFSSSTILLGSSVAVLAGIGLLTWAFAMPLPTILVAALLMAAYSLQYPIYLGRIASEQEPRARLGSSMATVRRVWILGYIVGLVLYSGVSLIGWAELEVPLFALLMTFVLQVVWRRPRDLRTTPVPRGDSPRVTPRNQMSVLVVLGLAISLLRATDSLRSTYFPLFAQQAGVAAAVISLLFAATAISELVILRPLGRLGDHAGSTVPLMGVAAVGICSMALVASGTSPWTLVGSQVLYAVFTSGFQLFGVQKFVEASRHAERGASLYQGSLQVGGLIGILLPLLIDGYGPGIFLIGSALSATALVMLFINARKEGGANASRDRGNTHAG